MPKLAMEAKRATTIKKDEPNKKLEREKETSGPP